MQGEILAGAGVGVRKKSGLTGAPAVKFLCGLIDILRKCCGPGFRDQKKNRKKKCHSETLLFYVK